MIAKEVRRVCDMAATQSVSFVSLLTAYSKSFKRGSLPLVVDHGVETEFCYAPHFGSHETVFQRSILLSPCIDAIYSVCAFVFGCWKMLVTPFSSDTDPLSLCIQQTLVFATVYSSDTELLWLRVHEIQNVCHCVHEIQNVCHCVQEIRNVCHCVQEIQNVCHCVQEIQNVCHCVQEIQNVCHCVHEIQNVCHCVQEIRNVCHCVQEIQNVCHCVHEIENVYHCVFRRSRTLTQTSAELRTSSWRSPESTRWPPWQRCGANDAPPRCRTRGRCLKRYGSLLSTVNMWIT